MMPYSAVVFDLDGTLLDTLQDLADSMNAVLVAEGRAAHPVAAYRFFVGDGMEMLARRVLGESQPSAALVRRCMRAMEREYGRRWDRTTRPYPGVPELLDALSGRDLRRAVLSNKPEAFTRLTVERLLSGTPFDVVRGARSGFPRKPDPAGALAVAGELGVAPGDCLYLGDTNTDMQTALAAGMFAVGATWGFRDAAELASAGARRLIDRPAELLSLL